MDLLKLSQLGGLGSRYRPNDGVEFCEQGFSDAQSNASLCGRNQRTFLGIPFEQSNLDAPVTMTTGFVIFGRVESDVVSVGGDRFRKSSGMFRPRSPALRHHPSTRFLPIPSVMATRSALSRVVPTLLKARPHALSTKASRAAFLAARGYASEAGHSVSPFCPNEPK